MLPSRWCHGTPGLDHEPRLVLSHAGMRRAAKGRGACGAERGFGTWSWSCGHVIVCTECGRMLRRFPAEVCPDRPSHVPVDAGRSRHEA